MAAGLGAAVAVGAASLIGQGANMYAAGKMNKKTRDWAQKQTEASNLWQENMWHQQNTYNEGVWEKQKAYNEQLWHMQNEYDSPAAQMARFKAAGLNPNLMYSQSNMGGSIDPAQMSSTTAPSSKKAEASVHKLPELDLAGPLMSMMSFKRQMIENNNAEINGELKQREKALLDAHIAGAELDNKFKLFNYDFASEMKDTSMDYKKAQLASVKQRMDMAYNYYDLDTKKLQLRDTELQQYIRESNQKISESVARTGSINTGLGLLHQKILSESANRSNVLQRTLTEEQKTSLAELQKRYINSKSDQVESEIYYRFAEAILRGLGRFGK